jgi:hypothetical protein
MSTTTVRATINGKTTIALFQSRSPKDNPEVIGWVKGLFDIKAIGSNQDGSPKHAIDTPEGDFSFGAITVELDGEKFCVLAQAFDKRVEGKPETEDCYGLCVVKKRPLPVITWE